MDLSDDDKRTIAAILRTHAELQDRTALNASHVLARLIAMEPENPLTLAMKEDLQGVEDDCENLRRIATKMEESVGT